VGIAECDPSPSRVESGGKRSAAGGSNGTNEGPGGGAGEGFAAGIRILGTLEALDEGRELPLGGASQRAVVAILLFI
jgi:hypothetical protein